jgi:membrane protein
MARIRKFNDIWRIGKDSVLDFWEADPLSHAAAIAFYAIFSLPAVLIIIISVAGYLFGAESARQELYDGISNAIGGGTAERVQGIIENTSIAEPSTLANLIGIGILLFSATTVFTVLQHSLNQIWRVMEKPSKSSIIKLAIDRGISFLMVLLLGAIMAASVLLDTALVLINDYLDSALPERQFILDLDYFFNLANYSISTVVITLIFAMIFKILPDVVVKWKDVLIGAIVTTLLFVFGKYLMGLYLSTTSMTSAYGAAGSLVILLMWVYYSSFILLYGANFTKIHAKVSGRPTVPRKRAVSYRIEEAATEDR